MLVLYCIGIVLVITCLYPKLQDGRSRRHCSDSHGRSNTGGRPTYVVCYRYKPTVREKFVCYCFVKVASGRFFLYLSLFPFCLVIWQILKKSIAITMKECKMCYISTLYRMTLALMFGWDEWFLMHNPSRIIKHVSGERIWISQNLWSRISLSNICSLVDTLTLLYVSTAWWSFPHRLFL